MSLGNVDGRQASPPGWTPGAGRSHLTRCLQSSLIINRGVLFCDPPILPVIV
jgi:hypothetical protein